MISMIDLQTLTISYGKKVLVDSVNAEFAPGTVYGLVAPNGHGKTTLLRAMAGLPGPRVDGSIVLDEVQGTGAREVRSMIFYAPGEGTLLYPGLRAEDHLKMVCDMWPHARDIEEIVEQTQIGEFAKMRIRTLSQGMKQQLTLAIAYATGARYLLLDEPMNALDPSRVDLHSEILRKLADSGTCIIMSSHILDSVDRLCDEILFLKDGRLIRSIPQDDAAPKSPGSHFAKPAGRAEGALSTYRRLYEKGGVRTESWTVKRSGLEVRMYSREKVELFLLATEDGMGPTAAAEFAGVSVGAAKKWATGHLPHSYTGARCRIVARKPPRKEASLGPDKSIYAPPATGPLAGLNEDQIENLLLRAVLADLKAEGWDPASISNRSKCELGERLRRATALPLRSITGFLRISKSSYEYWRPRVAAPRDRDADIRDRVVRIFREGSGCWGYRTVWARLRREGVRASEKRVARVMREEGLEVVYNKRRARGYSSYAGEVSKAPENLVNRRFRADEPNRLWLTDITEFRLPGGEKVYLSPIVDCFDGMPVAWSIGLHPDKRLANSSLLKACAARPAGARTTIHSDRGGHYRWPEWIGICEENGLVRSMSAKGCSPDNSACEGFFGRLKNEFFRYRDWEGVTAGEFMGRLEAYLVYYREERIKKSLGWLSPMEYRRKLGYA